MEITFKNGFVELSNIDLFIYAKLDSVIKDVKR